MLAGEHGPHRWDEFFWQERESIFLAFGVFDVDRAFVKEDVPFFKIDDFADTQTSSVRECDHCAMFCVGEGVENALDFVTGEDNG